MASRRRDAAIRMVSRTASSSTTALRACPRSCFGRARRCYGTSPFSKRRSWAWASRQARCSGSRTTTTTTIIVVARSACLSTTVLVIAIAPGVAAQKGGRCSRISPSAGLTIEPRAPSRARLSFRRQFRLDLNTFGCPSVRPSGSATPRVTLSNGQATKRSPSYRLTEDLAASYGGEVVCLHPLAIGQQYRLFATRQGPECNARIVRDEFGTPRTVALKDPDGFGLKGAEVIDPTAEAAIVTRVDMRGPLEQRAGYHEPCAGWSDGHDSVTERMIAALEEGDVLLVIDSPGGAHAGLQEGVRRVVEAKEQYGRHVIAYADEMIGSAAYWWAACVA